MRLLETAKSFPCLIDALESIDANERTSATYLKEFHRWRALTSWLLNEQTKAGGVEPRIEQTVYFLDQELSAFATSNMNTEREKFRAGIRQIVMKSASLDADLQKQRAVFSTLGPVHPESKVPYGYVADPEMTERNDDQPLEAQKMVELVVVPALRKRGNADGEDYDKSIVLVKCRVTQDPPEEDRGQDSPSVRSSSSPDAAAKSGEKATKGDKKGGYRSLLRKSTPSSK